MWAIISLLVENKTGILFKVTNLFRSRNFNIESISVGVTENPDYSRMTITTNSDEKRVTQIVKQLEKMIDTVCLLYTSPSPRDRTRSRMPSSA